MKIELLIIAIMKFAISIKKYRLPLILGGIITFFFSLTAIYTLKYTSPFCYADDWRFIEIFLIPFSNGVFDFRQLWSDPVHPDPITAILFILNAKYFNLQMNYTAFCGILFQFGMMIILIVGLVKSFHRNEIDYFNMLMATFLSCFLLFNFNYTSQYEWYLVTKSFFDYFLVFLLIYLINKYVISKKESKIILLLIFAINFLLIILSFHFALFANFSLFFIYLGIMLLDKEWNKKVLFLFGVLISSLILGRVFLSFMTLTENSNQSLTINSLVLLFSNFTITLKSIGIAFLSAIFNFEYLIKFGISLKFWEVISLPVILFFLLNFSLFFQQKIYRKSIFPIFLMLFSLVFIGSVLLVRYNPTQPNGIWCLNVDRYVIIYQVGLIGFFWNIFLVAEEIIIKYPNFKRKFQTLMMHILIFMAIIWGIHLEQSHRRGQYLINVYYPETLEKMKNSDISIVNQTIFGRDATIETLSFIKDKSLNIFAPSFPYKLQEDQTQNVK